MRRAKAMTDAHTALCWEVGDLLLEVAPPGTREGDVYNIVRKFKDDTGCDFTTRTLVNLRKCAHIWPPDERVYGAPWIVYWALHMDKGLMQVGMTIPEAAEVSPLYKTGV